MKQVIMIPCKGCDQLFRPVKKGQRYHSRTCYEERGSSLKDKACANANCGKMFSPNEPGRLYCSPECFQESRSIKLHERLCALETCTQGINGARALFTPSPGQQRRRYCSAKCSGIAHRKNTTPYRLRTIPSHPIAPACGIVANSRVVLYKKIGDGPHKCYWPGCGHRELNWRPSEPNAPDALFADHLNWDPTDDGPDNLVPSCRACNAHRRNSGESRRIKDDDVTITTRKGQRVRATEVTCQWHKIAPDDPKCEVTFLAPVKEAERRKCCSKYCSLKLRHHLAREAKKRQEEPPA